MSRIVIIGNSGGGKSTLARRLSAEKGLRHIEVDSLLWQDGWTLRPAEDYDRLHDTAIAGEAWIMDGLGTQASIPRRLARATEIVLIDMPLWIHFWLAAERQIAWAGGTLDHVPGGVAQPPPTEALFQSIWEVDQSWMPEIRTLCDREERRGAVLCRIGDMAALRSFAASLGERA